MSATLSHSTIARGARACPVRSGAGPNVDEPGVQWLLARNCSASPRQVMGFFASFCAVSFCIAAFFWWQGATLVMPFAGVEIAAVGAALLAYARHAADGERICLRNGGLVVEQVAGRQVSRVEFGPGWVRVEPQRGDRALIELSGQGQRVTVGRFVRPELRRQLADELRWALRRGQEAASTDSILNEESELKRQP